MKKQGPPAAIAVSDDLQVLINRRSVVTLRPSQAFALAETLVRAGMRQILREESADCVLTDSPRVSGAGARVGRRPR